VCIREVQNSIKDSVKQLLVDKIFKLGLGGFEFEVVEGEIRGPNGSLIIFKGMQSYNADNIKSLEGYDIAWVEEAQTLSSALLDMLRPTIRKPGSETVVLMEPALQDRSGRRVLSPERGHPEAVSVMINWRDNPWFPEELRKDMERDFKNDPDKAEHVWNGAYGAGSGRDPRRWVNKAERDGRIHKDVRSIDRDGPGIHRIQRHRVSRHGVVVVLAAHASAAFECCSITTETAASTPTIGYRASSSRTPTLLGGHLGTNLATAGCAKAKTFQSKRTSDREDSWPRIRSGQGAVSWPAPRRPTRLARRVEVIGRCEFAQDPMRSRPRRSAGAWEFEWNEDLNVFSARART
jgi:phage terminase large subunit